MPYYIQIKVKDRFKQLTALENRGSPVKMYDMLYLFLLFTVGENLLVEKNMFLHFMTENLAFYHNHL